MFMKSRTLKIRLVCVLVYVQKYYTDLQNIPAGAGNYDHEVYRFRFNIETKIVPLIDSYKPSLCSYWNIQVEHILPI